MLQVCKSEQIHIYDSYLFCTLKNILVDCNVTIKGYRGVIEFADQEYTDINKCEWIIVAPKGSKVNITFTSLKLNHINIKKVVGSYFVSLQPLASQCNNSQLIVCTLIYVKRKLLTIVAEFFFKMFRYLKELTFMK